MTKTRIAKHSINNNNIYCWIIHYGLLITTFVDAVDALHLISFITPSVMLAKMIKSMIPHSNNSLMVDPINPQVNMHNNSKLFMD